MGDILHKLDSDIKECQDQLDGLGNTESTADRINLGVRLGVLKEIRDYAANSAELDDSLLRYYSHSLVKWLLKIQHAIRVAWETGNVEGSHHKQWVIDQMLRLLLDDGYEEWLEDYKEEHNGEEWDQGIVP